jgi:hypothetical protein
MSDFENLVRKEARFIILRRLIDEPSFSLIDSLLHQSLDASGINRSRDWVRAEMRYLEQIGAVKITQVGNNIIATLEERGRDHVERRTVLDGVKRPSPGV